MSYDVIVIGSGIGGMYAASLLAKEGLKVLVVEKFAVAGGLMHAFKRRGAFFPTGVHYLGGLGKGQNLRRYFQYIGLTDKVSFSPFDPSCYEEYVFPDFQFQIPYGHKQFAERLIQAFPEEKAGIEKFVADMRASCDQFALYNLRAPLEGWPKAATEESLSHYLDGITQNKKLRVTLSANNSLYGSPPEECPVFVHFLVMDSFLQGAWHVNRGSLALAKGFVSNLRALGGEVRVSAEVTEICVNGDGVKGVRLANGECLEAPKVIYTGHSKHILNLLPKGSFRPAFHSRLLSLEETISMFGACLILKDYQNPLPARNVYMFDHDDFSKMYKPTVTDDGGPVEMAYSSIGREEGSPSATATLLTPMLFKDVARWQETRLGARPSEYKKMKDEVCKKLVDFVGPRIPGGLGNYEVVGTFTPLTMRDYVGAWEGTVYGIKKSVAQLRNSRLSPRTKVKGLFMAGQNIEMSGILGTVIGSVSCCCDILGAEYLMAKISKETL